MAIIGNIPYFQTNPYYNYPVVPQDSPKGTPPDSFRRRSTSVALVHTPQVARCSRIHGCQGIKRPQKKHVNQ